MPIPNTKKQSVIDAELNKKDKFDKVFREGKLADFNLTGGSWNEYASVALSLAIADTLLSIDRKLDKLIEISQPAPVSRPPIPTALPAIPATAKDIAFSCDKCGQRIAVDANGAGLQVQCPSCKATLIVPRASS